MPWWTTCRWSTWCPLLPSVGRKKTYDDLVTKTLFLKDITEIASVTITENGKVMSSNSSTSPMKRTGIRR